MGVVVPKGFGEGVGVVVPTVVGGGLALVCKSIFAPQFEQNCLPASTWLPQFEQKGTSLEESLACYLYVKLRFGFRCLVSPPFIQLDSLSSRFCIRGGITDRLVRSSGMVNRSPA